MNFFLQIALVTAAFNFGVAAFFFLFGRRCGSNERLQGAFEQGMQAERAAADFHIRAAAEIILKTWGHKVSAELQHGEKEKVQLSAVVDLDEVRQEKIVEGA